MPPSLQPAFDALVATSGVAELPTPTATEVLAAAGVVFAVVVAVVLGKLHVRTRYVVTFTVVAALGAGLTVVTERTWTEPPPVDLTRYAAPVVTHRPVELTDHRPIALNAAKGLMTYWVPSVARWGSSWWTTATNLDALISVEQRTGDRSYVGDIADLWSANRGYGAHGVDPVDVPFGNHYVDDSAWWGLAWLHAYQLTGDQRYLATAEQIDNLIASYWSGSCGGGVVWAMPIIVSGWQKTAITNETYLQLSAELAVVTRHQLYLGRAVQDWQWFRSSGLIRRDDVITDHLDARCRPTSIPLTYTQGPILAGLVALSQATGDDSYLETAQTLANASTTSRTISRSGILREPCEPRSCRGDAEEFKGSYVQGLGVLNRALPDRPYTAYLDRQADSVYAHDRMVGSLYGLSWAGPPDVSSPVRQAAVMSLFAATM
jgi:predicted alpha-1,6-mannanase (GH76 family)